MRFQVLCFRLHIYTHYAGEGLAFRRLGLAVLSGDIVKRAVYMRASKFNSRSEVVLCYFIVIFVRFLKYLKSMINKRMSPKWLSGMVWGVVLLLASCRTDFAVVKVEGDRVAMDSTWDHCTNQQAISLLAPYKMKVDSAMSSVLGMAAISMDRERPGANGRWTGVDKAWGDGNGARGAAGARKRAGRSEMRSNNSEVSLSI